MKTNLQKAAIVFSLIACLFITVRTQAQNNYYGYNTYGTPSTSVPINGHSNIATDAYGNVFIADADNNRIVLVNTNGIISTFAGNGAAGYGGDNGPAVQAALNFPNSVAVDAGGNVYIADTRNNRIRMVNTQGIIITIAGNGLQGFGGDGSPAIYSTLNQPVSISVDANRNVYFTDNYNNRVRMISATSGIITTVAGNGAAYYQNNNVAVAPAPQPAYVVAPAPQTASYQTYYDELSPYGQWVNTPEFGNVWVPAAGPDFVPYSTAGHWVYTTYGMTWVSDYSWGWCAFHYGRWDHDNYMGWFWVPGNEWGPAWVSWRSGNGYYGWAPLPPAYGRVSETNTYNVPSERYVFVQTQYITAPDVYHHYEPREQSVTYINNTTTINRTYVDNDTHVIVYAGPRKEEVEKYTGAPVKVYTINNSDKPGQTEDRDHTSLAMYRPKVQKPSEAPAGKAPAPAHVFAKEEVKPVAERPVITQPKHIEEKPAPVETHKDVTPNHPAENVQPVKDVNAKPDVQQSNGHPVQTAPNSQQPKTATLIKDKQLGKDEKGHVIYQDTKGAKYYMDEKGTKVIVPKPIIKPEEKQAEPVKPN